MAGLLLINPLSGDGTQSVEKLARAARERGLEAHVLGGGDDSAALARAADGDALGIAGGDGSLAAVAAVAVERGLPFACIPFGTRNHFARDSGLDGGDPLDALAAFDGVERRVDAGRVNGRLFLNNVSLGAYAALVHRRERHRRRREALAGALAAWRALGGGSRLRARIDGETVDARVLLIACNAYRIDLFTLGEREQLDGGSLHLYAAAGWLPRTWTERSSNAFDVELPQGRIVAAADGEPLVLEPPLRFEILPRALRLLVPRAPE